MPDFSGPPLVGGMPLSPVHWSEGAGVHADLGLGREKIHIPFSGQTTLPTFGIGGSPGYGNDAVLASLGGSLHNSDVFKP